MSIAVIVPTNRPERFKEFRKAWLPLFDKHGVDLIEVRDGHVVEIVVANYHHRIYDEHHEWRKFCFNFNDGVRNLGFLHALNDKGVMPHEVFVTLDDDVLPIGDPIQDHLDALSRKVPISWFSTASEYMRGFPYGVRNEAEVWVSHGVWNGVHDYDGPTQLVNGIRSATFYKGPIPKGCLTPVCGMNLAFKREAMPWMYFAPMGEQFGVKRFADIWMGIHLKRALDELGKAMVSGYAVVHHERASNVFTNLQEEARGILWNEDWLSRSRSAEEVKYQDDYHKYRMMWQVEVGKYL